MWPFTLHKTAWTQAKFCGKLPIRHISKQFFFFNIFDFQFFYEFVSFSLTCDPMGAKISKRCFSHNFDPISPKLYDKYNSHGGI